MDPPSASLCGAGSPECTMTPAVLTNWQGEPTDASVNDASIDVGGEDDVPSIIVRLYFGSSMRVLQLASEIVGEMLSNYGLFITYDVVSETVLGGPHVPLWLGYDSKLEVLGSEVTVEDRIDYDDEYYEELKRRVVRLILSRLGRSARTEVENAAGSRDEYPPAVEAVFLEEAEGGATVCAVPYAS